MRTRLTIGLLALAAMPVHAEIYKCTDSAGHVTYSNVSTKGCARLNLEPISTVPAAKPAPKTPTPSTFPRVEESTQKARDTDRRKILEQELAAEQKSLEQARNELAAQEEGARPEERVAPQQQCTTVVLKDGKTAQSCHAIGGGINNAKVLERLQPFKDKVAMHERNIAAINKELQNLR